MNSIDNIIKKLPEYFVPEKAKGVDTTVQLQVKGEADEFWLVAIKNQRCQVAKKIDPDAAMKVAASADVLLGILNGTHDLTTAYMRGDILFEGNVFKAMKFLNFFDLPDELSKKIPF